MRRVPSVAAVTALLLVTSLRADTPLMPIGEVRAGMVGTGRTVFSGRAVEPFTAHILGTLPNVVAPGRNLILARLEGGPLAETGVIAGMSGSPVYVDGRLIGAVAYQLGQFSKVPIAGITPIAEMVAAADAPMTARALRPVSLGVPANAEVLLALWRGALGSRPGIPLPADAMPAGLLAAAGASVSLQPIAVPLVTAGLGAEGLAPVRDLMAPHGFLPMAGGQASSTQTSSDAARTLAPGDAVGIELLSGDFSIGATGTVTHVAGDRVYAFGHPLYNLGPTDFPMTTAEVVTVLPSLFTSSKLARIGPTVGTLQQDRATAVAGRLGPGPSLIPMTVHLRAGGGDDRTFQFGLVRDQLFTPLLTYLGIANVLTSYQRQSGAATFVVRGTAAVRDGGALQFDDVFAGDQPAAGAAAYVAGPLTALLRNAPERVHVERITVTLAATEQIRTARIDRVWVEPARPRPGSSATVGVTLRTGAGALITRRVPIVVPANAPGSLQLVVADGSALAQSDARDTRGLASDDPAQLIRAFNRARRGTRLYVRLQAAADGAVVAGEPLTDLPPSALSVLESDRSMGGLTSISGAVRGEWDVPVDVDVTGLRTLTLLIDRP